MTVKHRMALRLALALAAVLALTCTYSLSTLLRQEAPHAAWAAPDDVTVSSEGVDIQGIVYGRVLINETVVMDKLARVGDESGYTRAQNAAKRLQNAVNAEVDPATIQAGKENRKNAVLIGPDVLIFVAAEDAAANQTTREALARLWAAQISNALYAASPTTQEPEPTADAVDISARRVVLGQTEVADVLINEVTVIKIRRGRGGRTAYQDASAIAERLRARVDEGYGPRDITAEHREGQAVVVAGEHVIATVDEYHADINNSTPIGLANTWADNIAGALSDAGVESTIEPPPPTGPEALHDDAWYEENYRDKWVPILSIPDGIRIGAARVNGASSDVRRVVAVAQLETPWEDFLEIDIYVPISTKTPGQFLDRVQGVGVTALADFDLTWEGRARPSKKGWSIFKRPKRKKSHPRFGW